MGETMKLLQLLGAAIVCITLISGATFSGELENFRSGKTVSNAGLPGEGEIRGAGIANGTAEPASNNNFPCGGCGFGPGSPDIVTNKTYKDGEGVLEFDDE